MLFSATIRSNHPRTSAQPDTASTITAPRFSIWDTVWLPLAEYLTGTAFLPHLANSVVQRVVPWELQWNAQVTKRVLFCVTSRLILRDVARSKGICPSSGTLPCGLC